MRLGDGEPQHGPRAAKGRAARVCPVVAGAGEVGPRPGVQAVDGRSGSGKSSLAAAIAGELPSTCVVHTDDLAWWHSFFGWHELALDGVLRPVRRGAPVDYRPPAWDARGREGAIRVPAGCRVMVLEGVGAGRAELAPWVDVLVWVQSDVDESRRRGLVRDHGDVAFWDDWQAAEVPFLAAHRPCDRADVVVCGTPECVGARPGSLKWSTRSAAG